MATVPAKVAKRMSAALRRFQPIIEQARREDVSEADTVKLVLDLLEELFGYDKYTEVTSQEEIRGSYCDLVVTIGGTRQFIIEVKAAGLELTDAHVKQAVDYAANKGVDWAILTNGWTWRVYKVLFGKPIDKELVLQADLGEVNPRVSSQDLTHLYPVTREGIGRELLEEEHARKQATNRHLLGAIILDESVLKIVRRELKRVTPSVKVTVDEIAKALTEEVLKREVVESEEAESAKRKVRATSRALRVRQASPEDGEQPPEPEQ